MDIKSDSVAKEDILDRKPFAREIAGQITEYFKSNEDSLVIGINGSWGSGKSTLITFIKDELKQRTEFTLFEFNPWMFSGKEELHKIFLRDFGSAVGSNKQKVRNKIKKVAEALSWATDLSVVSKSAAGLAKKFYENSIIDLKREVDELLIEEGIKSIVFLDDIDRLTPAEILEIFQLIRLNANFSNTIFIICFDKEVVTNSIEKHYGFSGEKYLEKIVQVDYSLPSILPERIESLFFENLSKLKAKINLEFDLKELYFPWAYKGLNNFFKNIRDLNRFFNSVQFRISSFHKNLNVHDFLILEAIRIFDNESYSTIMKYYKDSIKFGPDSFAAQKLNVIRNSVSGDLFKHLIDKKGDSQYRVFDVAFFDRYFSLSIRSRDVKEEDFQHYLHLEYGRVEYLSVLIQTNRIEFLLRRLAIPELYSSDLQKVKERCLDDILIVWSSFPDEFPKYFRFVWDVLKAILNSYDDANKGMHSVIDRLLMSEPLFSPARFVFKYYFLHHLDENFDNDLRKHNDVIEVRRSELLRAIEHEIRNHLSQFFFNQNFQDFYTRFFLIALSKYLPDVYKEQISASISNNLVVVFKLLKIFVLTDTTTGTPFSIDPKYEPYLLPDAIRISFFKKVRSIKVGTLPKNQREIVDYYIKHLDAQMLPEGLQKQEPSRSEARKKR